MIATVFRENSYLFKFLSFNKKCVPKFNSRIIFKIDSY